MQAKIQSNVRQFLRELNRLDQARVKAAKTAVRVELFRLATIFRRDVKSGRAGEQVHKPLSALAWWSKRRKASHLPAPLERLYPFVGYSMHQDEQGLEAEMGFVGWRMTSHWARVILKQQQGFSHSLTAAKRRFFVYKGGKLASGSGAGAKADAKYFFLRKTTSAMRTPGRDIVDTFWRANYADAWRNIKSNYIRKMAGERI